MARPLRTFVPGESLHVYNRGNNRMAIFHDDIDYESFLLTMRRSTQRNGIAVHGMVLMTTHFHLMVTPTAEHVLSWAMKRIDESYARYYNAKYKRTGTLWEGRYQAVPMKEEGQTMICLRYIDQNPVRARMVKEPGAYRWSSYRTHAFGNAPTWWVPHPSYLELGRNDEERQKAYRAICAEPLPLDAILRVRRRQ